MRQRRRQFANRIDSHDMRELVPLSLNRRRNLFLLGNIDRRSDPFMHTTVGRDDRHRLNMKMPKALIVSAYLKLVLVHSFMRHCLFPQVSAALLILRMKSRKPTKVVRVIFALPSEFLPSPARQEPLALCICAPDHIRAGHHQRPVARLAVA